MGFTLRYRVAGTPISQQIVTLEIRGETVDWSNPSYPAIGTCGGYSSGVLIDFGEPTFLAGPDGVPRRVQGMRWCRGNVAMTRKVGSLASPREDFHVVLDAPVADSPGVVLGTVLSFDQGNVFTIDQTCIADYS